MNALTKALLLLLIFSPHLLRAEDPVMLGIQSAINSFKSVPASTAGEARDAAIKILTPYLRPSQGGFYCRSGSSWIEVRGLHIKTTSLGTLSQADHANGITDSILVHFAADMHRRQQDDETWSGWANGNYGFLPQFIRVQKRNGQWSGEAIQLRLLQACNDQPIAIPSAATPPKIVQAPISSALHPPAPSTPRPRSQPTPKTPFAAKTGPTDTAPTLVVKTVTNGFLNTLPKFGILLVADYGEPGVMIAAPTATYLISKGIRSPMGANLSAFADPESAAKAQTEHTGRILKWNELANALESVFQGTD